MEKDKYYVPDLEEFHVGFEFECLLGDKWFEIKARLHHFCKTKYTEISLMEGGELRVKYLDQEDIESLGFFKWPDDDIYDLGEFQLHLGRYDDPYKVEIYDDNSEYCFVGVIKNKSELKKVLKMIGYEAD